MGIKIAFPESLTFTVHCNVGSCFSAPKYDLRIFISTKLVAGTDSCILSDT